MNYKMTKEVKPINYYDTPNERRWRALVVEREVEEELKKEAQFERELQEEATNQEIENDF